MAYAILRQIEIMHAGLGVKPQYSNITTAEVDLTSSELGEFQYVRRITLVFRLDAAGGDEQLLAEPT